MRMKMKKIATIIAVLTILVGCEVVMDDFELSSSEPKVVIEANVSSFNDSAIVSITKTADFLNSSVIPTISGAEVTVSFADTLLILSEIEPGKYVATYEFPEETEYFLNIKAEGKEYKASSYMPKVVEWDSITVTKSSYNDLMPSTNDTSFLYTIFACLTDPAETVNYYRFNAGKNDSSYNSIDVIGDELFSGKTTRGNIMDYFCSGDSVWFDLQSIDKANYKYYATMSAALMNNGMFSAPDNPVSNIEGVELGHFSAYSMSRIKAYIP